MQDSTYARFRGTNVLVADDSTIHRRLAKLHLEMMGCSVDTVTSGRLAIEAFQYRHYDLILMNCHMPGMDGFAATEAIRQIEFKRGFRLHVPIIGTTAFALPSDRDFCLRKGMDECLIKPVRRDVLEQVLSRWLLVRSLSA